MRHYFLILLTLTLLISCKDEPEDLTRNYRQDMRTFVQGISAYGRSMDADFIVVPQNGQELITSDGTATGEPEMAYLNAIDGQAREELWFGYDNQDGIATPMETRNAFNSILQVVKSQGKQVMVIDYCDDPNCIDGSTVMNSREEFVSFAADHRGLDNIPVYPPTPYAANQDNVDDLNGAKNFLFLINTAAYASKAEFITALQQTDHDVLVIDLLWEDEMLTAADIASLKTKWHGGSRLVLCYMSIGEAEDYRFYWQPSWSTSPPEWLEAENPQWEGNYKVKYWDSSWQQVIYGNDSSYTHHILDAGFDGVYLDIIDAFEYWEEK